MKADLVKAASEVITNQQILVNMVSRRVRQLCSGYRPLVQVPPGMDVPMIPELEKMLRELRAERPDEPFRATVMRVFECQNSMTHAAEKIGMKRITHHDLRHLFATICIESGVDIPTVSRWLGHKDGGALCMKTYGHLRQDHSLAQAQRVSFGIAA
jgi:integrase